MKDKAAPRRRKLRLAPGHHIQKDAAGNGPILVSPMGPVQLNDSAAAILALCDGTRTREEIVARIVRSRDDGLADDVRAFLDAARRRGWIVEGRSTPAR
jgi:pyrroloquinoline quinone biosynthesis protein D